MELRLCLNSKIIVDEWPHDYWKFHKCMNLSFSRETMVLEETKYVEKYAEIR